MTKTDALTKLLALGAMKRADLRLVTGWQPEELDDAILACKRAGTIRSRKINQHEAACEFVAIKKRVNNG